MNETPDEPHRPPSPAELRQAAETSDRMTTALFAAVVRMETAQAGTVQQQEAMRDALRIAGDSLNAPHMDPTSAVFTASRAGAILFVDVCRRIGIDPLAIAEGTETRVTLDGPTG